MADAEDLPDWAVFETSLDAMVQQMRKLQSQPILAQVMQQMGNFMAQLQHMEMHLDQGLQNVTQQIQLLNQRIQIMYVSSDTPGKSLLIVTVGILIRLSRIHNLTLLSDDQRLAPLVDQRNVMIQNFPETAERLNEMTCKLLSRQHVIYIN
jgi:hypothetical protein